MLRRFLRVDARTIYLYSMLTGLAAGLVAVLFQTAVHFVQEAVLLEGYPYSPANPDFRAAATNEAHRWLLLVVPAAGGLVTGVLTHFFGKEARGGGTDQYLDAFHGNAGAVRRRTGVVKFLATTATLGTGGSGGKEGPMTLIGAAIGSLLGHFIRMGARARRTLLLAGAAGGLGAIFRTPLGGAVTAVEVLYREDFETDALVPCIISSVAAYTTFGSILGFGHVLTFRAEVFGNPLELILFAALALLCTLAAFVFVKWHGLVSRVFATLPVPGWVLPAIGGLLVGAIGFVFPQILGTGVPIIQSMLNLIGALSLSDALVLCGALALTKMIATSLTIQSGGSAGLLIPCLFIGAMIGGATGAVFRDLFPTLVPSVAPFVIVGMASFFAAATNASLGALVMTTELTGGYELLPALMLSTVVSLVFSHRWSIYTNQKENKFYSKAHLWDMNPTLLNERRIEEAFPTLHSELIVPANTTLPELRQLSARCNESQFFLSDEEQRYRGSVNVLLLREHEGVPDSLVIGADLAETGSAGVSRDETLLKALEILSGGDSDKIPVTSERGGKGILLGYLTRQDILRYYRTMGA